MDFCEGFGAVLRPDDFTAVLFKIRFPFYQVPVQILNYFPLDKGSPLPCEWQVVKLFLAMYYGSIIFPDIIIDPFPVFNVKSLFFSLLFKYGCGSSQAELIVNG